MTISLGGLGSGLDVNSIVSQLVGIERLGQNRLESRRNGLTATQTAWQQVGTSLSTLRTTAAALTAAATVDRVTTSSSHPDLVSVTALPGARPASAQITVLALARPQQLAGAGVASPSSLVGVGTVDLGTGTQATGLSLDTSARSTGAGGAAAAVVTRASSGATLTGGTPPLAYGSGGILGNPESSRALTVAVGGGATSTITLDASYSSVAAVVSDLNGKLPASVRASLVDGRLQLTSTVEGSATTLRASGTAATSLGLGAETATGTDGEVRIGNVTATIAAGTSLTADDGTVVTAGSRLRTGIAVGTGSTATMSDVAAALQTAGSPVTAALVDSGDGSAAPWRLVLGSSATGAAGAVRLRDTPPSGFPPLSELQAGTDAEISYGSLTVRRPTNTMEGVVPGATLQLLGAAPGTVVTVGLASDDAAVTQQVQGLVDSASAVLSKVYGSTKRLEGALLAPPLAGTSARDLGSALWSAVGSEASIGVRLGREGTYSLDAAQFAKALEADRDGTLSRVAALAGRLEAFAKAQDEPASVIQRGLGTVDSRRRELDQRIEAGEARMLLVERRYRQQFTAMDTAISQLRGQSDWLAGQIKTLPGYSR